MAIDPRPILADVEAALSQENLPLWQLLPLQDQLDDVRLELSIVEFVGQLHNDPDTKPEVINSLRRIRRRLGQIREARKFAAEQTVAIGVTGGVGVVGGSVVAIFGAAFPPAVLVAILGGGAMVARAYFGGRQLNRERVVLEQMTDRMDRIVEKAEQ